MARHLSGRQPRLNVGVTSYTDSLTVLQVTGKVAIGTTNAGPYSLYVVGDTNIIGQVGLNTITAFSGIITNLAGTNLNYAGIGTINNFISTTASINTLDGNIVRFNTGIITSVSGNNLFYRSGIVTNILGTNLNYTGIGTVNNFISTTANITNLSGSVLRFSSGIATNIQGTNLFYSGIGTIGSFLATNSTILTLNGSAVRYSSGIVTNISGTNLNYSGVSTFNASSGPLFVGIGSTTGTPNQILQVVGIQSGAFFGGNVGIGSTRPTSKLSVQGDVLISGVVTSLGAFVGVLTGPAEYAYSAGFSTVAVQAGVSTIASVAGFATVSIQAGVSTIAAVAGFATFATIAGYSTVSGNAGFATFASISGFSTVSSVSGFATVATHAGVSTISSVAGFATVSTRAGVSTLATYTYSAGFSTVSIVSGVSTFSTLSGSAGFSTVASIAGFTTVAGVAGFATVSTQAGISTSVIGGVVNVNTLNVTGISSFTTATGPLLVGGGNSTGTTSTVLQVVGLNSSAYIGGNLGIGSTNPPSKLSVVGDASIVGVVTANNFFGPLTGIAASATQLVTPRTFNIVGAFVTAANILFDGTGNVSFAATIVPDSIGLGTYTSGDYVRYITGTSNQIVVTGGLGEGSTPQIGLTTNVTISNNLSVTNDLFVGGNVSVAGTSFVLNAAELRIEDRDLVLGFTTTSLPSDTTANHGGIAIASTEGIGLVPLQAVGLNTFPDSYKQLMWVRSGTWTGLTTDAFIFNYGVGIGSTQVPNGVRLSVGSGIQMTDTNISSPRGQISGNVLSANLISGTNQQNTGVTTSLGGFIGNLTGAANYAYAAGFSTFSSTSGFSTVASIAGFTTQAAVAGFATNATRAGVATFSTLAGSAGFATVATQAGISTNTIGGVVDVNALRTTGIATFSAISVGGTTGINQYVLTSTGLGLSWQAVTGIGAISGVNITPDNTNKVYYIPFVNVSAGTTATQYVDTNIGLVYNPGLERLGIGTTNPGDTLDVQGTLYVRDYITSPTFYGNFVGVTSGVTFYSYNAGVSTIASIAGFATVSTQAGVSSYSTFANLAGAAGFATVSSVSGFSTFSSTAGFATVSTWSGISTIASVAGFATVAIQAGVSTISAVAGFATVATRAGIATLATYAYSAGFTTFSGVAGFATVSTIAGVATLAPYAYVAGFSTYAGNVGFATFAGVAGFATVSTQAGISTSVVGGVANVTSLNVSGVSTLGFITGTSAFFTGIVTASDGRLIAGVGIQSAGLAIGAGVTQLNFIGLGNTFLLRGTTVDISIAGGGSGGNNLSISTSSATDFQYLSFVSSASTSILGISSTANPIVFTPSSGNLGLGTTAATSKLTVRGDVLITGVTTSTGGFRGQLTGVANYSYAAGFSTYSGSAGFSTISAVAGFATVSTIAGVATFANIASVAGFSTFASTAGFATVSTQAGISSYSLFANLAGAAGFSTFSSTSGFSTFASVSGFSTVAAVAGFSSVTTQAGVATISAVAGFSTFASISGFSTFASTSGFSTVATQAGIATNVVTGVASIRTLQVTGISTFTFGPVYIGAGQTIGVTSAIVQITGINSSMYVGGKVGIGTTDLTYALNVNGDINTSGVIRVNGRNILDDAVIFAIALG